jgi:hypothetical protein
MRTDKGFRFQFRLRTLFAVIALAAIVCAVVVRLARHYDARVISNALVGKRESEIVTQYGRPSSDHVGYTSLGFGERPPIPPGGVRTLIFKRADGGTLWVWLNERDSDWICFESCWFGDGVMF